MLSTGLQQFNEITVPYVLDGEKNLKLIAEETEAAKKIAEAVDHITTQEIDALLLTLDNLDFQHAAEGSILLNPKLPYIALAALRQGFLNEIHGPLQVATLLIFWAASQQYGVDKLQTLSLFNDESEQLIKKTLRHPTEPHLRPYLYGKKFATFLSAMKTLPASETKFLYVPASTEEPPSIPYSILVTHVNVFNLMRQHNNVFWQIIPSCGMMQAFLSAQFRKNGVRIKPCTYLATTWQIRETRLSNTSIMMLPTPNGEGGSRCPLLADNIPAPWNDFSRHDFFHAIVSSNVDPVFRKMGVGIADLVRGCVGQLPIEDRKGARWLAFSMIDMEYIPFYYFHRQTSRDSQMNLFWQTINLRIAELNDEPKQPTSQETELQIIATIYNWLQASTDEATFRKIEAALKQFAEELIADKIALLQDKPDPQEKRYVKWEQDYALLCSQPLLRFWEQAFAPRESKRC